MQQKNISVIIPIYNSEKFIDRCIKSILNQNYKDIEIICVDDCSTDNSLNILKAYQKQYNEIIILSTKKRSGAGISRNLGLTIACGEYIHFVDIDDFLIPNIYKELYSIAHKNNIDILRTKSYLYDYKTGKTYTNMYNNLIKIPKKYFNKRITFLEYPQLFFYGIQVAPWAGLFKRKFLIENNIKFNSLICVNDRSFFAESIFKANSIMFVEKFLINYTVNNNDSLIGNRGKYFDCHFKSYEIIESISNFLPKKVQQSYLNCEIYDILYWLFIYSNSIYRDQIISEFNMFINSYKKKDSYNTIMYKIMKFCFFYIIKRNVLIFKNNFVCRLFIRSIRFIHLKFF